MITVFEVQEPIVYDPAKGWLLLDSEVSEDDIMLGHFEQWTCHMARGEFLVVKPAIDPDLDPKPNYELYYEFSAMEYGTDKVNSQPTLVKEDVFGYEVPFTDEDFRRIFEGLAVYQTFGTRPIKVIKTVEQEIEL